MPQLCSRALKKQQAKKLSLKQSMKTAHLALIPATPD
jgi:hypothetical protein